MKNFYLLQKLLFVFACFISLSFTYTPDIDEAKQFIYYERYASAAHVLHHILKNDASNAEAWYLLTKTYLLQNKTDKIKDSLLLAPLAKRNDPYYQVAYGYLQLQQNKKDSAHFYFGEALNQTKEKDAAILSAVAQAHIDAPIGDAHYAIELLNKAAKREKRSAAIYTLIGNAYRKLNNGTDAYKAYQQALAYDQNNAAALYQLGNIFLTQKNSEMYLKFFRKALAVDPNFAPAYYSLYTHYYTLSPEKAMGYFNQYVAKSDVHERNEYQYTDLLYLTKRYGKAIAKAQELLKKDTAEVRLHKLIAYSQLGLKDTAAAMIHMRRYFSESSDSSRVIKDFETMGLLYASIPGKEDSAALNYQKAVNLQTDSTVLFNYYKKLAQIYKKREDYSNQALWLGKYYANNEKATNIDLFNWGIAHYMAHEWSKADSVFGVYIEKFPEQTFGYYWRARSNAALDSALEKGTAIPHYLKLVKVAEKDPDRGNNKKWLIEAYGYLATYEANIEKDYQAAIEYFKNLLALDPENRDAEKYIAILEKNISRSSDTSKNNKD
ncbi:tetratricopeptide repeat protein [Chitinophagaceae bacterium LB-8]|uniref:Tetratricopeptide repeat protein n=1 Tax=Paraflavisolibacter caeni TaxID=2982496 RepID=A0A9X3BHB6_9BACT|nr:tetratricopeptide repeat protein [Paraflavisolibacter caeni]MCU7549292.1 tetratricopeptide repeat protein [Paraflavisolibacter caeni]